MLPTITIGPLSLPVPGLLLLIGLWIGINLSEYFSEQRKIDSSQLYNLVLILLISGFLGARLAFILAHPAGYLSKPLDMFALNLTAFDPWGAIAGAIIAGLAFNARKKLSLLSILDALTPLASIMFICVHLANFASGAAYGSETNLPWAVTIWGAARHPVQLYETAGAVIIFMFLWKFYLTKENIPPGKVFLVFIGLTSGARLFLEGFHGDSEFIGDVRIIQIVSWCILAGVLYFIPRIKLQSP